MKNLRGLYQHAKERQPAKPVKPTRPRGHKIGCTCARCMMAAYLQAKAEADPL